MRLQGSEEHGSVFEGSLLPILHRACRACVLQVHAGGYCTPTGLCGQRQKARRWFVIWVVRELRGFISKNVSSLKTLLGLHFTGAASPRALRCPAQRAAAPAPLLAAQPNAVAVLQRSAGKRACSVSALLPSRRGNGTAARAALEAMRATRDPVRLTKSLTAALAAITWQARPRLRPRAMTRRQR
jgi:hypothetical protein